MLIDVKYAVNDRVKFKYNKTVSSKCDCGFCGSLGRVRGLDGSEEDCPRCDGRGYTEMIRGEDVIETGDIRTIGVYWKRNKEPKVYYIMSEWKWSTTEIPQEDIIGRDTDMDFEMKLP